MWRANSPPVPGVSLRSRGLRSITLLTHICGSTARAKTSASRMTMAAKPSLPLQPSLHLRTCSLPDLLRGIDDHPQLRPLLLLAQHVAFLGGGKAALWREAQLLERGVFGGLVEPALDVVLLLEGAVLGGDEAD